MERLSDYAVGETLAGTPYRVTKHIATGGMGSVYEVEDASLGKRYALKTLRGSLRGDPAIAKRMRQEARMLGRLTHPNVVQVFTAGVTQDLRRVPYFVMELLVGSTLRGVLRARPMLGVRTSSIIILELLGALEQAHDLGLVHRDIKPDNVFLHRAKRGVRTTKLLDFGVADLVESANLDTSTFFGTFRYASPEQLRDLPISCGSDLYAVGLLLYEMLAGSHPFAHARTRDDLAQAHLYESPVIPSSWSTPIRALVRAALAKDAKDRPRDAWTFASRLRKAIDTLGLRADALVTDDVCFDAEKQVDLHAMTRVVSNEETQREATLDITSQELLADSAHATVVP